MPTVMVWRCTACRKWIRDGEPACSICGGVRPPDAHVGRKEVPQDLAGHATSGPAWYCTRCEEWSPADKMRCLHCGCMRAADAPTPFVDDLRSERMIQSVATPRRRISRYPSLLQLAAIYAITATVTLFGGLLVGGMLIAIGVVRDDMRILIVPGVVLIIISFYSALLIRASSELLRLAVDIEENTRRTADAVEEANGRDPLTD